MTNINSNPDSEKDPWKGIRDVDNDDFKLRRAAHMGDAALIDFDPTQPRHRANDDPNNTRLGLGQHGKHELVRKPGRHQYVKDEG